jgi:hypothetical protein
MKRIKKQPWRHYLFRYLAKSKLFVWTLSCICAQQIKKHYQQEEADIVCLILMGNRFRGDIENLTDEVTRQNSRLVFLHCPHQWLGRFYRWFYWYVDVVRDPESAAIRERRKRYREFLLKFLPSLVSKLNIQVVLGSQLNDAVTVDWGAIFHKIDAPYIVFHREGFMGSDHEIEHLSGFGRSGRMFEGSLLVVQTELMRQILVKSKFVEDEKTAVGGVMRMDSWLRDNTPCSQGLQKQGISRKDWVTFFSFGSGTAITMAKYWPDGWRDGKYLFETTCLTHVAVAQFAEKNRNVPVMIKPKWDWDWTEHILYILEQEGIFVDKIPNLHICSDIDAQEQIRRSRVVVGYGSTTLLEAAVSGKVVIVPEFGEIAPGQKWAHTRPYPDISDCFEIADSRERLSELIKMRYEKPRISVETMQKRVSAFERYVSFPDGSSTSRSLALIHRILSQRQQRIGSGL